jgi:hypothetical protein
MKIVVGVSKNVVTWPLGSVESTVARLLKINKSCTPRTNQMANDLASTQTTSRLDLGRRNEERGRH